MTPFVFIGVTAKVSLSGLTCKWKYLLLDVFLTVFGRRVGSTWVYQQVDQQSTLPPLSSRDVSLPSLAITSRGFNAASH